MLKEEKTKTSRKYVSNAEILKNQKVIQEQLDILNSKLENLTSLVDVEKPEEVLQKPKKKGFLNFFGVQPS